MYLDRTIAVARNPNIALYMTLMVAITRIDTTHITIDRTRDAALNITISIARIIIIIIIIILLLLIHQSLQHAQSQIFLVVLILALLRIPRVLILLLTHIRVVI